MSITLPNASTANTDSNTTNATQLAATQAAFIASTTVLINEAITNGMFFVEPILPSLVTSDYVTSYFQALGYTVTFPIIPPGPFEPTYTLPEVTPPGYIPPGSAPLEIPRIKISWSS